LLGVDLLGELDGESIGTADVAEPEGVSSRTVGTHPQHLYRRLELLVRCGADPVRPRRIAGP
jgi:hypothetical protein